MSEENRNRSDVAVKSWQPHMGKTQYQFACEWGTVLIFTHLILILPKNVIPSTKS